MRQRGIANKCTFRNKQWCWRCNIHHMMRLHRVEIVQQQQGGVFVLFTLCCWHPVALLLYRCVYPMNMAGTTYCCRPCAQVLASTQIYTTAHLHKPLHFSATMQLSRTGYQAGTCRSGNARQRAAFKAFNTMAEGKTRTRRACTSLVSPAPSNSSSTCRSELGSRRSSICRAAVVTAEPGQTTLGFCGIGIMGLPMVSC